MKHSYFILVFFIVVSSFGFAQQTILCGLNKLVSIKDSSNISAVTDNGDGTITLTHKEPYITDIFAKYVIYDFIKGTSTLYTLKCQSRD